MMTFRSTVRGGKVVVDVPLPDGTPVDVEVWQGFTPEQEAELALSEREADRGKVIPHEQVMAEFRARFGLDGSRQQTPARRGSKVAGGARKRAKSAGRRSR